ncbi:hypothetical protein PAMA_004949 [Pampus argenteus]
MELDAKNQKISLDHILVAMKNQLADRSEDLNQLKMLEKGLCAEIRDAEKTVALTEEKCATTTQRIPEIMELEKTEKDQISQLKFQIEDQMQKNKKLKEKLIALQEDAEKTKLNEEAEVSCLKEQLHSKNNAFAALRKENMEYEQNMEDYKIKISESEKAVKQMCEERKQMLQKITDNDEHWERAKEEVTQVVVRHSVTQNKLEEQEQLTFMEEQRARKEIVNLRKDLTGQMTALELLKGQCADINDELHRQQRSSELINNKLQSEYENVSSTTKALETDIEKIKRLTENLEKIQSEHKNTLAILEREKKLKCEHLKAAKEALIIALKENKQLASENEGLKKILMEAKREAVSALTEKNHAHKSFNYYTQKRMHKALVKYFKQRSLYSQAELDQCQSRSQETDQKIKTAQTLQEAAISQRPSLKRPQQITAQGREEWGTGGGAIRELQSVKDKRARVFKRTTPSPVTAQHRVHQSKQDSL